MRRIISEIQLGDMTACYETDESHKVGLLLCPAGMEGRPGCGGGPDGSRPPEKVSQVDSLVQLKLAGDAYNGSYAMGQTLREGSSVKALRYAGQRRIENETGDITIETVLKDDRGYEVRHILKWKKGKPYVRMHSVFRNQSDKRVELELLSSFSLQNISPWLEGDCHEQIKIHRIQGRWSEEGRLQTQTPEELQLETSWAKGGVRCERFGSVGSMPVNKYFPFLALEDCENHVFWGAQLEAPSSWQMEIYRIDDNIAVDGGIADREFGHWMKMIGPGESFTTWEAIVTVCQTDRMDILTDRLTDAGREALEHIPECEKSLPIIFNEYCTTWGNPSHGNIKEILESIKGKGFGYFVIDCGWFKEDGIPWDISMGDYQVSPSLFPEGMQETADLIRKAGMKPGIWFEIETAGPASRAYKKNRHFLQRDGVTLTTDRRRFWDMQDPWVQEYLDEKVIGTLKKYGFEYMKVDYNDDFGIGADGCESPGEMLRRNMEATYHYFEKAAREIPGLVLENCASGGHRLEPGFMKRCSMASFSDAHECVEIPIIAANLHRVILPQQSQIWAVIRETDSLKRIAYSVINTFLGRMCISGDVTNLSREQWDLIERGMEFYRKIAPVIAAGCSYHYDSGIRSMRHPRGWQVLIRGTQEQAYAVIHIFGGELPGEICIPLPEGIPERIEEIFSDREEKVWIEGRTLHYVPEESLKAVALRIVQ